MKNYVAIGILGIAAILSSCTRYYYMPATHSVPLFTRQGDLKLSAGAGCGESTYSFDMQGAYSILDHFSVSVGCMGIGSQEEKLFNEPDGLSFDAAAGLYLPLSKGIVFETYGGIGGYNQHNQSGGSNNAYPSDVTAMRLFLQPDVGYVSRKFEIAFSSRITKLNFTKVKQDLVAGTNDYIRLTQISRDKMYTLVEPAITVRFGGEDLKFQVQLIKPFPEEFKGERLFDTFHVNVGFIMTFPKDYWKKVKNTGSPYETGMHQH